MKMISLMLAAALLLGSQLGCAQTATVTGKNYGGVHIEAAAAHGATGSPIGVEIRYTGLPASGASPVTYATEGALKLAGASQKTLTPDSKGAFVDTVVVQAASDGAYFLNVFATTPAGTSVVSIPVTVGSATFKPAAAPASAKSASGSQRIIEMPAQETLH